MGLARAALPLWARKSLPGIIGQAFYQYRLSENLQEFFVFIMVVGMQQLMGLMSQRFLKIIGI